MIKLVMQLVLSSLMFQSNT